MEKIKEFIKDYLENIMNLPETKSPKKMYSRYSFI